jgi:hypothetical protein
VRAANAYFHRVDEQSAEKGRIWIDNRNAWAGDTWVEITLSDAEGGATRVEVESKGHGINAPAWNRSRRDITEFLRQLALEIKTISASTPSVEERLLSLDALRAKGLVSETEYAEQRKAILSSL